MENLAQILYDQNSKFLIPKFPAGTVASCASAAHLLTASLLKEPHWSDKTKIFFTVHSQPLFSACCDVLSHVITYRHRQTIFESFSFSFVQEKLVRGNALFHATVPQLRRFSDVDLLDVFFFYEVTYSVARSTFSTTKGIEKVKFSSFISSNSEAIQRREVFERRHPGF